jgi:hypothetical protein
MSKQNSSEPTGLPTSSPAIPKERKFPMPNSAPEAKAKTSQAIPAGSGRVKGHHNVVNGKSHGEKMRHS